MKRNLPVLALLMVSFAANSQKTVTYQSSYWLRYYGQLSLAKNWSWHNELEERRFFEKNRQQQFIVHSHLHYSFYKNVEVANGFSYSRQSPQEADAKNQPVIPEFRLFQEVNYKNSDIRRLSFQQRFRLDERFVRKSDSKELLDGYQFSLRYRYRLQANYRLQATEVGNVTTIKLADELMINSSKNIIYNQFDQNRIYLGLECSLNKNISGELGYMFAHQQRASGDQFFNKNIIRLTMLQKLSL